MKLTTFLGQHSISQSELAEPLGLTRAAVSYKINGHRPWKRDEINKVLAFCRRYDPEVTYEDLFGSTDKAA